MQIVDKQAKENVVAKFLSRVPHQIEEGFVDDYIPYEHLFATTTQTPWFADIANYLVVGKLPQHFNSNEKS